MQIDKKYYAIFSDHSGLDGIPIFMEARIFETMVTGDPFGNANSKYYDWMKPGFQESSFANPLYLYTKNERFAFDYRYFTSDFILSKEFLDVVDHFTKSYTASKLIINPSSPAHKLDVHRQYFYVRFDYHDHAVDYECSVFETAKADNGEDLVHNGVRYVKRYHELKLKNDIYSEVFLIKDPVLNQNLFCSEDFKKLAEERGLYGLIFVPVDEFIDFKTYSGFLGKETYERLKSRKSPL